MTFHLPHAQEVEQALARADAARVRLADAIAASDEAAQRRAKHAVAAIGALIPRYTDPEEGTLTYGDTCGHCGRRVTSPGEYAAEAAATCRYCGYRWTDDTLATIAHLRSHADIYAQQGLAEAKLRDLDRWEQHVFRSRELFDRVERELKEEERP